MNTLQMAVDMPDCEGISKADGQCSLKAICAAVPLLNEPECSVLLPADAPQFTPIDFLLKAGWLASPEHIPIS